MDGISAFFTTPPDMVLRDLHPATKLHSRFNASPPWSAIVSDRGTALCLPMTGLKSALDDQ